MPALSFLVSSMALSLAVEMLNIRMRRRAAAVHLHASYAPEKEGR